MESQRLMKQVTDIQLQSLPFSSHLSLCSCEGASEFSDKTVLDSTKLPKSWCQVRTGMQLVARVHLPPDYMKFACHFPFHLGWWNSSPPKHSKRKVENLKVLDSCYSWLIGQWKSIHPNRQGLGKSSTSFSSSTGLITTASARFNSWLILLLHVLIHSVCGGTFCSLKVNRFIRVTEADLWHRFQLVWRLILCLVLRVLKMFAGVIWNANSSIVNAWFPHFD